MGLAAAVGLATVAYSATAILTSIAIVGAAVSVVGAVTKNRTLSQIGMGLSLVGGIGALATGALGLSTTALFGSEAVAGAGAEAGLTAATAAEGVATGVPDAVGSLTSAADTGWVEAAAGPTIADAGAGAGTGALDDFATGVSSTTSPVTGTEASTGMAAAEPIPAPPDAPPYNLGATNPATGQTITSAVDANGLQVTLPPTTTSTGATGMLSKLTDYASAHPMVAFGAVQGISSLIGGWTSTLTPAQVAAANAQAAQNQAAANFTAQQTANLAAPKAVASSAPVTGAPAPLVPAQQPQPGFINTAPNVTGKVAA